MNVGLLILVILGGAIGIAYSAYLLFGMPAVILWKLYRKVRYGISMYD